MSNRSRGGAANWSGSEHERGTAAYLACHCLARESVTQFDLPDDASVPLKLRLQADEPVDDIVCELSGGGRAFLQARTSLDFTNRRSTGLVSVVSQWVAQMGAGPLDPERDRLLAVANRLSHSVEILRGALDVVRHRPPADLNGDQRRELERLEAMLSGLPVRKRRRLLRCPQIWVLRVSDDLEPAQNQCRQLLGSNLVGDLHRKGAWERLRNVCAGGARLRLGFDRDQLCDELRKIDIPLREDEPGSKGARRGAVVRYLDRLQRRGSQLDFAGLGATIPPLTLDRADAEVRVSPGGPDGVDQERWGYELPWALRRWGRVLLTGLPGAGKSTALKVAAAAYASRPEWPMPIFARLDQLAERPAGVGIRQKLIEIAVEEASGADRKVLAAELDRALDVPGTALFLDALDEARDRRHQVLRDLRSFLDDLPPGVEIVLATRDLAYADAGSLEFFEIRLLAPKHAEETAHAVLDALAARLGPTDEGDHEDWVKQRVKWVEGWLGRDKALSETPLVVVLLSMLAAVRGENDLPETKAAVMAEVVEAVIEQWEGPAGRVVLGNLRDALARRALQAAFVAVSGQLASYELPPVADVQKAVAAQLATELELPLIEGEACAEEALAFWDQAGFFVITSDRRLLPRLRLFAELGEAQRVIALSDAEIEDWIATALADPTHAETLRLAAQLSRPLAEKAVAIVAAGAEPSNVVEIADVTDTVPMLSAATRRLLAEALIAVVAGETGSRQAAAEALVRLDLPATLRRSARRALRTPPITGLSSYEALLALGAAHPSADEREAIRRVLDTDPEVRESGEKGGLLVLSLFTADAIWSRAVGGAFERLLPDDPSLVPRALQVYEQIGGVGSDRVADLILRYGDDQARSEVEHRRREVIGSIRTRPNFLERSEERHAANRQFLAWLAGLAQHIQLDQIQARRFDALIDLWRTLDLPSAPAFEPADVLKYWPRLLRESFVLLATLGAEDLSLVASEAQWMLDEIERLPEDAERMEGMLNMGGGDRKFDQWQRLEDRNAARQVLHRALGVGRWLSWLAIGAIAASDPDAAELDEIVALLPDLRGENRQHAGLLVVAVEGEERVRDWLNSEDTALRGAAAWWLAKSASDGDQADLVATVLDDSDDSVRDTFLRNIDPPAPAVVLDAVKGADLASRPWTCLRCREDNPAGNSACQNCHVVAADTRRLAEQLLEGDGADR